MKKDKDNELATVDSIRKGVEFKGANLWILIFAIFMASLGLNVNSTAVIIGAMLISPLMGPIMGVGLSVGLNDFELMKRSLKSFLITTAFSVTTATIFFLLAPIAGSQSELLARTSPTIYDVFIALFGGLAGVVALSTKEKGNVIPGVAIATALMPPLCTAGYGLASGNLIYFLGAFYLYFINSVFISKDLSHKIPQYRFLKNENYIFDIDFMHSEKKILNKFEHSILPLQEYIQSTRGAEISKKGLVCKCSNCDKWFPYPKNKLMQCPHCDAVLDIELLQKEQIISKHSKTDSKRLKVGEDLYRYTSFSKSYIDVSKNGINYKKINNYNGTKILVRKTGVGITASIDYEDSITNQVVYILKLQPAYINILTLEFVLSVINSRAITYYLIKKYGENEWRTHPYITQTILAKLPFPDLNYSSADNQKIIKKITDIVKREVRNSKEKNISAESDIHIERMIAKLFGLNRDDYESIFQTLNSAEQLIPIKRLTNCNAEQIFKQDGI